MFQLVKASPHLLSFTLMLLLHLVHLLLQFFNGLGERQLSLKRALEDEQSYSYHAPQD